MKSKSFLKKIQEIFLSEFFMTNNYPKKALICSAACFLEFAALIENLKIAAIFFCHKSVSFISLDTLRWLDHF